MKKISGINISSLRGDDGESLVTGYAVTVSFDVETLSEAVAELASMGIAPGTPIVVAPPIAAPTVPPPVKANRVEPEPPAAPAEAPVRRGPGRPPKSTVAPAPVAPAPVAPDDLDSMDDDEPTPTVNTKTTSEDEKLVQDASGLGKIREVVELVIKRKSFTKAEQVGAWVRQYGARIEAVARLGDKGVERAQTAADMMLPDDE